MFSFGNSNLFIAQNKGGVCFLMFTSHIYEDYQHRTIIITALCYIIMIIYLQLDFPRLRRFFIPQGRQPNTEHKTA